MQKVVVFDFYNVLYNPDTMSVRSSVVDVLKDLHSKGIKLFLFTNSRVPFLESVDSKFHFLKYFDDTVSCFEDRKPSDYSFKKLKETIGLEYTDMIFVDDNENNLFVGKGFGMIGVKFNTVDDLSNIENMVNGV